MLAIVIWFPPKYIYNTTFCQLIKSVLLRKKHIQTKSARSWITWRPFCMFMPGVWILWRKKKIVIIYQKENGNTFTLFIIFIVKSLQKDKIAQIYYNNPQSTGINLQSSQSDSTPWTLTLCSRQCWRQKLLLSFRWLYEAPSFVFMFDLHQGFFWAI